MKLKVLVLGLLCLAAGVAAKQVTIPDAVMKAKFGRAHSFSLKVRGPDPVFTQGGYTFQVVALGYELSDEYYYDVPVYIIYRDDIHEYRIVSTKGEGYSVGLTIVKEVTI